MIAFTARAIVRATIAGLILLVLSGVGVLLLEGSASVILFSHSVSKGRTKQVAERQHTQYDGELGWVNRPNVLIPDLYGKGMYLRTNSQGFRNNIDFSVPAPPDRVRVVCSGDSFTLGYGVDNDHTWCQLLTAQDHRIESVNMGQGGYGIDQAYLWYRRDGVQLGADVHLFAFINEDFNRVRRDTFLGYGKPLLRVHDGELITSNVPVPKAGGYLPAFGGWLPMLRELRAFQLAGKLGSRLGGEKKILSPEETRQVALRIFESLRDLAQAQQTVLVLVYLPTADDCRGRPRRVDWWSHLQQDAARAGIRVVDLSANCRERTAPEVDALFIGQDDVPHPFAAGHYTARGNEFVAAALYRELTRIPDVGDRLAATQAPAASGQTPGAHRGPDGRP